MQNDNLKYAIALTGGLSTGKSTVCSLFGLHGFAIIDADKISKEIFDKNQNKISKMFDDKFTKDGKIDRKLLANFIFEDKQNKQKLENFLHPLIKESIIKKCKILETKQKPYIVDIPLFFETNNYDIKTTILVYATKQQQIKRAIKRDMKNKTQINNILSNQLDIDAKLPMATYVIYNNKDMKHLQHEVERVKNLLLKKELYGKI